MEEDQMEEEAIGEPDVGYLDEPDEVEDVLDDRPMKVYEGLYIGSLMAEMNKNCLLRTGITDVLQVAQGLYPHHPLVFNYMNIQVQDMPSEDLVRFFPSCFEFIDRAISKGGAVLVHCAAGVSRSATVVLGYMMSRYNMTLTAAVEHLKAIRPWVSPNTGFLKQLETYQGISFDMTKWRAWQVVWQETQQQNGHLQQQEQQQHWVQIPQVHVNGSTNGSSTEIPGRSMNGMSNGAGSTLHAAAPAAAAPPPWRGNSLDRVQRDSSSSNSSSCCCCLGCGIGCCFNGLHPSANSSSSSSASITIKCNAAGETVAAPQQQQQQHSQESSNRWSSQFRYSSSAPECRSQTFAAAACVAACAAAGASGNVLVPDATVAGRNGYNINGIGSQLGFASGSHISCGISNSHSSNGHAAAAGVAHDLDSALNSAASYSSCLKGGNGLNPNTSQQGAVEQLNPKPQRRHVAFALENASAPAAAAVVGVPMDDVVMEDSGGYLSV